MGVSAKRSARIGITVDSKGMDQGLAEARRRLRTFEREQARNARRAVKQVDREQKAAEKSRAKAIRGGIRGGIGMGLGIGAGLAGLDAIGNVASEVLDYERNLTRLQIAAGKTPEYMRGLSNEITNASKATGIGREQILGAATAYVTLTGDMDTARASADDFAKIAQATGSNVDDIAKAAAAASQNLGITSSQFESMFDTMTGQGKAGAIELKDMAAELSTIAPQWAQFANGKGLEGARKLGAAMQIVKKGFGGDAGETTVGVSNFLTAITKKASRFEGLNFFTETKGADGKKTKQLKDVFSIIDLISKSKIARDPETLTKAFGSIEAYRAYIQLRDNREELDKLADSAQYAGTIQKDFNTYMQSSAGRLDKAFNEMKIAVAAAFTPERIASFASALEKIVPILSKMIQVGANFVESVINPIHAFDEYQRLKSENEANEARRKQIKEQMLSEGFSDSEAEGASWAGIHIENQMLDRVKAQSKGVNWTTDAATYGDAGKREGVYSGQEALALGVQSLKGGQTNAMQVFTAAVAAAVQQGMERAKTQAAPAPAIKIGAEPIQKAAANSINHRRGQH